MTPSDAPEASPDIVPIQALHRGSDGHVGFAVKDNSRRNGFRQLGAVSVGELGGMFDTIREHILQDSYFTVNSFGGRSDRPGDIPGTSYVSRKGKYLKYLNACYADLDVGRPDSDNAAQRLEFGAALGIQQMLVDLGHIPPPTMVARSGRGAYLFWFLRHREPEKAHLPAPYTPGLLTLYKLINRELVARLASVAADRKAIDGSRYLRVPGSIHTVARRRVEYWFPAGSDYRGFTYTLDDLAQFLDVRVMGSPKFSRRTIEAGAAPERVSGHMALGQYRADDLLRLEQWRQGFRKRGSAYADGFISRGRRDVLSWYTRFLIMAQVSRWDIEEAVGIMAANCVKPYPSDPSDSTVAQIIQEQADSRDLHHLKASDAFLCEALGVTREIAEELELVQIVPADLKAERKPPTRAEKIAARREAIREWVLEHSPGSPPAVRKMVDIMKALHPDLSGLNRQTINDDYREMGWEVQTPGRPKRGR